MPSRTRRSYDQFCATARALDSVGDRWALLIVRELLAGPRRYTDLHADLPGVSTDVLAARLKQMEADGLVSRRPQPRVYELTGRGRALLPVLDALAHWGAPELPPVPGETDAVRAHWWALPLRAALRAAVPDTTAVIDVSLPGGVFHLRLDDEAPSVYGEGPAPEGSTATLALTPESCATLLQDRAQAEKTLRAALP
ncbi:winged helix-turn-helix transcriptional regulator [Streptomyces sp. NPDC048172]|uniref:winged helix-turn-helix transcriptional regulator n=1 Tax=Streptomyces sp. NPDC048172 TaxID=3365505 RepID=UPI003714D5FB